MIRFALAVLAVVAAQPVRAGVILQYEDDEKKQTTVELDGKKLRSFSPDHGKPTAIFDGDQNVFYMLDDKDKSYRRIDETSGTQLSKGLQDAMEKAKARMSPEQRAQMEAYLAKQQGTQTATAPKEHTFTFEKAGGSQKVAGYACDNYRVLRDGTLEDEGCFVPWQAGVLSRADLEAFKEMGRFFEKTFATMNEGHGPRTPWANGWITHFVDSAPGFPVTMDRIDKDGKKSHEMHLVKLERTTLVASRFSPPPDYREKPMLPGGGQ